MGARIRPGHNDRAHRPDPAVPSHHFTDARRCVSISPVVFEVCGRGTANTWTIQGAYASHLPVGALHPAYAGRRRSGATTRNVAT